MWSVGCIMAELLTGQVLFKGNDRILSLIVCTCKCMLKSLIFASKRNLVLSNLLICGFYQFFKIYLLENLHGNSC